MNPEEIELRDCGHMGQMLGVCQYNSCAAQLCPHCLQICETCQKSLCPGHQHWMGGGTRVFCKEHAKKHLIGKAVRWLLPGRSTAQQSERRTARNVVSDDIDTVLDWIGRRRNR